MGVKMERDGNAMIILPYPVPLNRAYRNFQGTVLLSAEGRAWKKYAAWQAMASGMKPLDGAVWVNLTLHPRTTESGKASKRRVDLDSIFKLCLDALNGVAYHDDKQVERLIAEIGHPVKDGGLTVMVGKL